LTSTISTKYWKCCFTMFHAW